MPRSVSFTILGEAASKANSRQFKVIDGRVRFVRSAKALRFACSAALQIPNSAKAMLEGPLAVTMRIFYCNHRSDLDESIVLDVMQASKHGDTITRRGVYLNDRQIREKHIYHGIDPVNPRVEVTVSELPT